MNQSEFLAITCNLLQAREKSHVHGVQKVYKFFSFLVFIDELRW